MQYILVVNPLKRQTAYLKSLGEIVAEREVYIGAKVLFSNFEGVDSGWNRLQRLAKKWWRLDAKIALSLFPRLAMERYAPTYMFRVSDVSRVVSATVRTSGLYLTLALADITSKDGKYTLRHLFETEENLERFFKGERVFQELAFKLEDELQIFVDVWANFASELVERSTNVARSWVEKIPGSFDIIASTLQRFNVDAKDVVDFAVQEAKTQALLEELRKASQKATPAPTTPAGT